MKKKQLWNDPTSHQAIDGRRQSKVHCRRKKATNDTCMKWVCCFCCCVVATATVVVFFRLCLSVAASPCCQFLLSTSLKKDWLTAGYASMLRSLVLFLFRLQLLLLLHPLPSPSLPTPAYLSQPECNFFRLELTCFSDFGQQQKELRQLDMYIYCRVLQISAHSPVDALLYVCVCVCCIWYCTLNYSRPQDATQSQPQPSPWTLAQRLAAEPKLEHLAIASLLLGSLLLL